MGQAGNLSIMMGKKLKTNQDCLFSFKQLIKKSILSSHWAMLNFS